MSGLMYRNAFAILGEPRLGKRVKYRDTFSKKDKRALTVHGLAMVLTSILLVGWILAPTAHPASPLAITTAVLMVVVEAIRVLQTATLWAFARNAADPIPLIPQPGLRVAVLTTMVPGKEPFELIEQTLRAMRKMTYASGFDVWLLDEGNDPIVKAKCEQLGVNHFSRKGVAKWNALSGPYKAKTKHGNHNAWRDANEAYYDVVAQMDPDHVPVPEFLERTLGYFQDPDVGFVVAPQVYGNLFESWIARGSAYLAYVFHGIIQRGGNGMRAPLLIGTNHLYRVQAFREIGGYQDCIIEDHLTSMRMYETRNMRGKYWKGVYTPDILAVGEGPTSFTDFFNQQQRWAYGIWEIVFKHSPRMFKGMHPLQRLSFAMLQFFYPSVALSWVLSFALTALFVSGETTGKPVWQWGIFWGLSMASTLSFFLWLRKFNLVEHERKDWGWIGMSLMLMCIPVYVSAAWQAIRGENLTYAVTAKGDLASPDNLQTFMPHLKWAGAFLSLTAIGLVFPGPGTVSLLWLTLPAGACLAPAAIHLAERWHTRRRQIEHVALEEIFEHTLIPAASTLESA